MAAADLALSSERLAVLVQGDNDSDVSEDGESVVSSGATSQGKLLDDIADDLRNDTQCLLDLGARFEEQVMNPIVSEAAAKALKSSDAELYDTFIERIMHLYPQCESYLAERLGKARWLRFLRMVKSKPQMDEGLGIQDIYTAMIHDATKSEPTERKPTADATTSWGNQQSYDSGLGTVSFSSHLNSVRTTPQDRGCLQLPAGVVEGQPFHCMVCKNQVTLDFGTQKEWRCVTFSKTRWLVSALISRSSEHVLGDIAPYVCPEPDCGDTTLFTSKHSWKQHVYARHYPIATIWKGSKCRICGRGASDRETILRHLAEHMEDIAFADIPRNPEVEAGDKVVGLPLPPGQTHDRKLGDAIRRNHIDENWPEDFNFYDTGSDGYFSPPSHTQPIEEVITRHRSPPPWDKPLPPIIIDDPYDTATAKRARNISAARKSRQRMAQRLEELKEKIAKLEQERNNREKIANLAQERSNRQNIWGTLPSY